MRNPTPWRNWAGNIEYAPAELHEPASTDDVAAIVAAAAASGRSVRAIGTAHSSNELSVTPDLNLRLGAMTGIVHVDADRRRVRLLPGTRITEIGPAIWEHGLCLKNQGDIDAQHIAGAVGTGTHGSGKKLQSFSGSIRAVTAVNGRGDIITIDESDPERLAAAQVGLGLIGIYTELELEVRNAFFIHESIQYWTLQELYERWDEYFENRLHFSFFWYPATGSPAIFNMRVPNGRDLTDHAYVKIYDEVPLAAAGDLDGVKASPGDRVDRPYVIYPEIPTDAFHELEYMIPYDAGMEAFAEVRDLIYTSYPENVHPVEVRCVARDDAYISPQQGRDNIVIAVHCDHMETGEQFLRDTGRLLQSYGARPHWGKLTFMDDVYLEAAFPRLDDFRRIRRSIDPDGTFLNDYTRALFE